MRAHGRLPPTAGADRCGGSIPVTARCASFWAWTRSFVGFGLDDDRVHSPNEKFELACYEKGIRTHAAMLARFAGLAA